MKVLRIGVVIALLWAGAAQAQPKHLAPAVEAINRGQATAAIAYLLPLANKGDAEAQFMLVSVYQSVEPSQSNHWLFKAADNKHPAAAHIVGLMYLHGNGVTQDVVLSVKWLSVAAHGNIGPAQRQLAELYRNGPNSIQDDKQAAHWMTKAAVAGDMEAQFHLADMYRYGYGVKPDAAEMKKWLQKSAAQGYPKAVQVLGELSK